MSVIGTKIRTKIYGYHFKKRCGAIKELNQDLPKTTFLLLFTKLQTYKAAEINKLLRDYLVSLKQTFLAKGKAQDSFF